MLKKKVLSKEEFITFFQKTPRHMKTFLKRFIPSMKKKSSIDRTVSSGMLKNQEIHKQIHNAFIVLMVLILFVSVTSNFALNRAQFRSSGKGHQSTTDDGIAVTGSESAGQYYFSRIFNTKLFHWRY
ncbi:MAG: hypothetical protein AB2421_00935 [Thermotaleaceae bacterium]